MPKATVTIDLPDGWELAANEMRPAKRGEWKWDPSMTEPIECIGNTIAPWIIVRRIATEYVNVKLRREDAKHFAGLETYDTQYPPIHRLILACKESLRDRCGFNKYPRCERLNSAAHADLCTEPHHYEANDCTLPAGHAGEHGV